MQYYLKRMDHVELGCKVLELLKAGHDFNSIFLSRSNLEQMILMRFQNHLLRAFRDWSRLRACVRARRLKLNERFP